MSDCKHCDAGIAVTTWQLGDVSVPGMHRVPTAGGYARMRPCKNNQPPAPTREDMGKWAELPFFKLIKRESE